MYNPTTGKQVLYIDNESDAGDSENNPILAGLSFDLVAQFSGEAKSVSALVGLTTPPATPISFSPEIGSPLVYKYRFTAAAPGSPFAAGKNYIRTIAADLATGALATAERHMSIAALPTDAIQVYSQAGEWVSVNFDEDEETIPVCSQMTPIRFFPDWFNEFGINGFGGANRVSIFDYASGEGDEDRAHVKRIYRERIDQVFYIYLEKHVVSTEETHDMTVNFRSDVGDSGVEVRIKVKSAPCWGFEIKDPVVAS